MHCISTSHDAAHAAGRTALLLACAIAFPSCAPRGTPHDTAKDRGVNRKFERGPVTVVLNIDRENPSIADRINLSIEVTAKEDYEVQLPSFGEKLEQFGIVDYHTSQPELVEKNTKRVSRSYVLEPFLSGDYKIPPMKVVFWKEGDKDAKKHEIETETVTIKVSSLLPENLADLKIREIVPPVELPRSPARWIWLAVVTGAATAALAAGIIIWKRRHRGTEGTEASIPAHEIAFRELEKLIDEDLTKKGQIKLFYQRISDILRHYIENRFDIHAPEQTTEEFLQDLESSEELNMAYRTLLKTFLSHCDLVKFAEHQPATQDIQKTFDSCKAFIVGTKKEPEQRDEKLRDVGSKGRELKPV